MPIELATPPPPSDHGTIDGLAYTLWLPERVPPLGRLVILHGAGSRKESHHDMARAARGHGLAAVAFDMRGHGASADALDDRLIDDVRTVAGLMPPGPLVLRGSSMGGAIALLAAAPLDTAVVLAICPAPPSLLLRGLRSDAFDMRADVAKLEPLLDGADLGAAVDAYRGALLLMHADGDERVPLAGTRALHERALRAGPGTGPRRLIVVPGGHHSSVQHDDELQAVALRFALAQLR